MISQAYGHLGHWEDIYSQAVKFHRHLQLQERQEYGSLCFYDRKFLTQMINTLLGLLLQNKDQTGSQFLLNQLSLCFIEVKNFQEAIVVNSQ